MHWSIGEVGITSIVEQPLGSMDVLIPGATPEVLGEFEWLRPHYVNEAGEMTGIIQAFIVDAGDTRIVVDTCVGDGRERKMIEEWHQQQRGTIGKFARAGYPPDTIDVVLCTHLHVDHVGWNTYFDGSRFVPTFPNARYLFAASEFRFWQEETARPAPQPDPDDELGAALAAFGEMMRNAYADSIRPVLEAGLVDLVETDHVVCDAVRLVPSPGHTPGHVSVEIRSGGERALITGDAIHHPCQIARPDLGTVVDALPEQAVQSRRGILDAAAEDGRLVIGSHFSEPSGGVIRRDGGGYRMDTGSGEL